MIRTRLVFATLFTVLASVTGLHLQTSNAQAVTASDWKPGRIIDDSVFQNRNSMSVQQIQQFLDSKVPSCDRWGTLPMWSGGPTRAQWSLDNGRDPAPYTCLKEYVENPITKANNASDPTITVPGGLSAAELIFNASQAQNINPQVYLVLLQKEQSLVTDDWPYAKQFERATGNNCPDTAPCNPQFAWLWTQVNNAGAQFNYYVNNFDEYNYAPGWNNILYNPNSSCGTQSVFIENAYTAALYIYTPYVPNQAALNNMYGTGDGCSAYGNRNFWRLFNDWFGSTTGPDYSWSIESYTYSGGDNSIAVGQTETITLRAKNNGRQPWYNHGNHPVRLGTWSPANRASNFFPANRLATLQENSVMPGAVGTFTFQVTPQNKGIFIESLNLVAENHLWLPWTGLSPTVAVTSQNDWRVENIVYERGTGVMDPGTSQLVTVIVRNTGTSTWQKLGGNPVRLGTWQPTRQSTVSATWQSPTRAADTNELTVAPGATAGFQFYVTMPPSGGPRYEKLNLVMEGIEWFDNKDLTLFLFGNTYAWSPVWHSHSTGTAAIPRNTDFSITLKAKNTGTVAWTKSSGYPMRVATTGPQNRGSAFETPTWISPIRPAGMVEDVVLPGQEGTFIISARTPSTPGQYFERLSLIAEGVTWLNDPGFRYYVNVL